MFFEFQLCIKSTYVAPNIKCFGKHNAYYGSIKYSAYVFVIWIQLPKFGHIIS